MKKEGEFKGINWLTGRKIYLIPIMEQTNGGYKNLA